MFLTKTKPLQEKMWLIRKLAVGFASPAGVSAGISCSLGPCWQQMQEAAALPSPLSALWLGLESQGVKNSKKLCRSCPVSSFPCQGCQTHAFFITSAREQILSPSKAWGAPWGHTPVGDRGITGLGLQECLAQGAPSL